MSRKILARLILFLTFALAAQAQRGEIRGQILMPDGNPPARPLQFLLTSSDGRMNELYYTDSSGRFSFSTRGAKVVEYTITVEGDGSTFATTQYSFGADWDNLRITLNGLKPRPEKRSPTISAASVYRPKPGARKLRQKALKELARERHESAEASLRRAIALDP